MKKFKLIPYDLHTITPHLVRAGATQAVEFCAIAFDAVEEVELPVAHGKPEHPFVHRWPVATHDRDVTLDEAWQAMSRMGN